MRPRDAQLGWNWTFWELILRPLLIELGHRRCARRLSLLPSRVVRASAADVELTARDDGTYVYVIAVRRSGDADKPRDL
jgi:hypothetical protein